MKKMYKQGELSFSIVMILLYLVSCFILRSSFGKDGVITLISFLILSIIFIKFIYNNKLSNYYGLVKVKKYKKYLYFIPLIIVSFYNVYNGKLVTGINEFMWFLNMLVCGFLEIIVFYGFFFKSISKKKKTKAILITSILFGFQSIFNILNGIDPVYCILNSICMCVIGWTFGIIFIKTKSIIPCIICNSILSSFSIYVSTNYLNSIISTLIVVIICILYTIYLERKC